VGERDDGVFEIVTWTSTDEGTEPALREVQAA
jgi:hypothetical protein